MKEKNNEEMSRICTNKKKSITKDKCLSIRNPLTDSALISRKTDTGSGIDKKAPYDILCIIVHSIFYLKYCQIYFKSLIIRRNMTEE